MTTYLSNGVTKRFRSFALLVAVSFAAPAWSDELDDAIEREMARRNVPGVGIVVVKDGKIIREKGYGLANVEHKVPVTAHTIFQSGSVGKTFTATLVLLLAEDGKLKLDDPISKYLENIPVAWEKITIRHLLHHTSGLGDPTDKMDFRKDYTDDELIALEATIPLQFAAGQRFTYSNIGYQMLGFIITKAGGKFWGDQLHDRIVVPLGMGASLISETDIVPHRAAGYDWVDKKLKNQEWVSPSLNRTADGTLYLTARDLALWDQALSGDKILSARQRETSLTLPRLADGTLGPYAMGWFVGTQNGSRKISHGGSWQGFKAIMNRYIDEKLTVIVLANSKSARQSKLADMIAAHYVPGLATVRATPILDTEPKLATMAREAIEQLAAGKVPAGLSDAERARFTPTWVGIHADEINKAGRLRSVELLTRSVEGDSKRVRYRFTFKEETLTLSLTLGASGAIERLVMALE